MSGHSPEWHVEAAEEWLDGVDREEVDSAAQQAAAMLAQAHLKIADIKLLWRLRGEDQA